MVGQACPQSICRRTNHKHSPVTRTPAKNFSDRPMKFMLDYVRREWKQDRSAFGVRRSEPEFGTSSLQPSEDLEDDSTFRARTSNVEPRTSNADSSLD